MVAASLCAIASTGALCQSFSLDLGTVAGGDWSASEVRVTAELGGTARVKIAALELAGRRFKDVSFTCGRLALDRDALRCEDGALESPDKLPLSFTYESARGVLTVQARPATGEEWRAVQVGDALTLTLTKARLDRLAPWLPGEVKANAGAVSGTVAWSPQALRAQLAFDDAGFADTAGLRAGEKLRGRLDLDATTTGTAGWSWRAKLAWEAGAVFWDPIYVAEGGHVLDAAGEFSAQAIEVKNATLTWAGVGRLDGSLYYDRTGAGLRNWAVRGQGLQLAGLRPLIPTDWLEGRGMTDLAVGGAAAVDLAANAAGFQRARVALAGVRLEAKQRNVGISGVNLAFAYEDAATPFKFAIERFHLRDLAFGPFETEGEVRGGRLTIPHLIAPVLDGVLALNDLQIARVGDDWQGRLTGAITPLSMPRLTAALGWHPLAGTISAVLPQMTYAGSTLSLDGALLFKVFNGDAKVDNIRLANPFGRTPRFTANVRLRGLDLEEMTGAVKFGTITGRIDVDVDGLEMENWEPLLMDAKILTSPGEFRKRISQRAVQNISSIGGAGAGAAIQASFMRFFDTFGYDKIGLSCRLRNGVCEMGGVERTAQGYTIIKGGGIPALNVVGYNRFVGWGEMLERIQAVIEGNSKMIVQ